MTKVHDGVSGECVRRVVGKFRGIYVGLLGASLCVLLYLGLVSLERGGCATERGSVSLCYS